MGKMNDEIKKNAEEYANNKADSGNYDYAVGDNVYFSKSALEHAYIAGATSVCSSCSMSFKDMTKEKPTEVGRYLVIRDRYGVEWSEVLMFDGKSWVTGPCDAAFIVKWCKLEA